MDKKKAIVNTLFGKIQERSAKLFEDVNNEMWDFGEEKPEKDYDLSIDGEEVKEDDEPEEEKVSAMDVILDSPVNTTEKDIKEI